MGSSMTRDSSETRAGARINGGEREEKDSKAKIDEIEHNRLPVGCVREHGAGRINVQCGTRALA
jgi:hypothetical protein